MNNSINENKVTIFIFAVSVAIPAAIAVLLLLPHARLYYGFNTRALPLFHAVLNGATALLLLASLFFIRKKRVGAHKAANLMAVALSSIFLVSYVIYHSSTPSVKYGDLNHDGVLSITEKMEAGSMRYIYYFILTSHILLSAVIIPLVLFTLMRAFQARFDRHRRLARITWPIWLYVAVTGVLVYALISPYY